MNKIDMRFKESFFSGLIGKEFKKYKCDPFVFTNTVTKTVGLYIGDQVYELRNEQEQVDYFGAMDDMAVWHILETQDKSIQSAFLAIEQINTPVEESIKGITLVDENQFMTDGKNLEYDIWLTRAVIFHLESRDICFEKDTCAFSEEIEIVRGYNLKNNYPKTNKFFLNDWNEDVKVNSHQIFIEI